MVKECCFSCICFTRPQQFQGCIYNYFMLFSFIFLLCCQKWTHFGYGRCYNLCFIFTFRLAGWLRIGLTEWDDEEGMTSCLNWPRSLYCEPRSLYWLMGAFWMMGCLLGSIIAFVLLLLSDSIISTSSS